ncbi:MAG: dTDP-4-dehydrorhamnose reductase [Sedimentisphaerales bacterium]|nr:dTDP-4-dehydrorhamnose reductase [Sedimentisphaerales bacterium]
MIGASGMLGSELVRQLNRVGSKAAHPTRDRNIVETVFPYDGSGRLVLDITDYAEVERLISSLRPKAVYNCSAYTDVDKAEQEEAVATAVNGTGVENLAKACLAVNAYFVHVSTDYVFNGQGQRPYRPDDATDPQGAYGRSKLAGEESIRKIDGRWLIVRTSWLFGRGGRNFVDTILKAARKKLATEDTEDTEIKNKLVPPGSDMGETPMLRVVNDQTGCPTSVIDLADCLIGLVQNDCQGMYHFCNGPVCTWYDFAKKIIEIAQLPCRVEPCTSSEYPRPAKRPSYSVLDCSETFESLGWKPCSLEERLHEYIKQI